MADKIFRVNMSDLTTKVEEVPAEWLGHGGRGLTSNVVASEVEPTCHPLGKKNKLQFVAIELIPKEEFIVHPSSCLMSRIHPQFSLLLR